MDEDSFRTILKSASAQTKVLGSRFLGTVFHAESLEDLEEALERERTRYYDATHWCPAARIGLGADRIEKSSDAGEPRGTAGLPILRELQRRDLTDCAIIVTRYFGGTKLGTGGLARAYGECAAAALDAARIETKQILSVLRVRCGFDQSGIVYHAAGKFQAQVVPEHSGEQAEFDLRVAHRDVEALMQQLVDESSGKIHVEKAGQWIS